VRNFYFAVAFAKGDVMIPLSPETEELINARARASGKTPDEVVREALSSAPTRRSSPKPLGRLDHAGLTSLLADLDAMQIRDTRPTKIILDEGWGL
jgi:hypothetical protein